MRDLKPAQRKPSLQPILQEPGINTLLFMNPRRATITDTSRETGTQTAILTSTNVEWHIELSDFDTELTFSSVIFDVLCCLGLKGTKEGFKNNCVHLSVREYMQETATADRKIAKKRLRNAVDFLTCARVPDIDIKIKRKKGIVESYINISSGVDYYKNGDIDFYFNPNYLPKLIFVAHFTTSIIRTDSQKLPYVRSLGYYISIMKRTNTGKPKEDLIKLETLLEEGGLPSFETVKENGRHYEREIIEPFEKNMDAIEEISWHYCNNEGRPLKRAVTDRINGNLLFFDPRMYIKIIWKCYPNTQPLLEKKEKQKAKAEKTRKKKEGEEEKKRG